MTKRNQKQHFSLSGYPKSLSTDELYQINEQLLNLLSDYIYTVRVRNTEVIDTIHGPGCKSVTGYSQQEFTENPQLWYDMVHPADREVVTRQAAQALQGYDVEPLEHRIIHRSGEIRWIRNTIVLLRNEQNELYAYNGLIHDITKQKKIEQAQRENEERYRSLIEDVLESTGVGISILDAELNIVWVNKAFTTFLGIPRDEIIGRNAVSVLNEKLKFVFDEQENMIQHVLNAYKNANISERHMAHILPKDGVEERYVNFWSTPIHHGLYAGGRIDQYTDVTELKIILDDLLESERRQRQLVNHLTDYTFTVKINDGRPFFTHHSQGCYTVTGYDPEEFILNPQLWLDIVHKNDKNRVQRFIDKAMAGEQPPSFEYRIIHKNGTERWVKATIVLDKDESGTVQSADGLITDITELKKAERRDKIRQRQLIQADKLATLGILVSGVAHEINNPNNFISLNAKMIEKVWRSAKPVLDDYQKEHGEFSIANMPYSNARDKVGELLSGIINGSARIQKIVKSLKDYARQDTGSLDENVNINHVVEEAILIVHNLIKKSTTDFEVDYADDLPPIKGNFQKLEQVLINLISNACDAMNGSVRELGIQTGFEVEQNTVKITIRDTGAGIPEQDMEHIFDPFFTTKRETGGTGLGLSIAYGIVKDHGGELSLESEKNKGTTAHVTLPLYRDEEQT